MQVLFKVIEHSKDAVMKICFYHTLPVLFSIAFSIQLYGQSSISGKVLDGLQKPVAYANVLLLNTGDSALVQGQVANETGGFVIEKIRPGRYIIAVSMIGYHSCHSAINITGAPLYEVGTISLEENTEVLGEALVEAKKPLYEQKVDRLVVNVQSSITAAGNSVLGVLQKSPGISVNKQNGSISMYGKSGVTVMINNRVSRLPIDAVLQMLDGMSAANVEKIEFITNPPAKYDAEGTAGMINIVMVENADFGTNGNYGATAGVNGAETLGANFNLNHRRRNFSFFTEYSILYDHNRESWDNRLRIADPAFTSDFNSITKREPYTTVQNFRTGAEINLSKSTSMGALVTLYQRHYKQEALTQLNDRIAPDSSRTAAINIRELNRWQSFTANINLSHSFNEKNRLRFDFDFLNYHNLNPSDYHNESYYPERKLSTLQIIDIKKETPIFFKVANVEYTYQPLATVKIEAGVKGTLSTFKNDVEVSYTEGGLRSVDPELTVVAKLDEKITAGYVSADWSITKTTQLNAGLRYEHTSTYISTQLEQGVVDRNFGNFFPSVFFKKSLSDQTELFLSYSRRITRPTFNDMAPFVYLLDLNTFFSGNPALRPAITDGYNINFRLRQSAIALSYTDSKNEIAHFQPEIDPVTKKQTFRSQNLEYQKLWGLALSVPWTVLKWWEIQANANAYYRDLKTTHLENNVTLSLYNYSLNLVNSLKLPKQFSIEVSGFYESKMLWGMWHFKPLGSLNIGIQKKLNNNHGTLSLAVDDIFYTNIWKLQSQIPEANSNSISVYDAHFQSIRLTYTRSFGNNKLKDVSIKSGSEEERRRVQ
ncbi:outer membrane beta-barrel family protein [Cesiribacter sp. SM1]|uniref:outer membrane beta-barrel family protein n=1 Tax=Cesiribacter sp. SM1 TaxID=2861196 RepID=UPI001CD73A37|nr:outer membrane beta-barrel family protein [Cesiribacter sp. SM1]